MAAKQPLPAGQMAGVGVGVLTSWTVGETRPVTHAATSDWMSVSRPLFLLDECVLSTLSVG